MRVYHPDSDSTESLRVDHLQDAYLGYVIYLRPEVLLDDLDQTTREARKGHWFWGTVFQSKGLYLQVALAAVVINLFALAVPLFTLNVYDRVIPNNAVETLNVLAAGAVLVFLFDLSIKTLRGWFIDVAGKRADVILACRIFDQLLDIKLSARPGSAGAFANTLREFETVRDFFTSATLVSFVDLPFGFLFITVIFLMAPPLTLVYLGAITVLIGYSLVAQVPMRRIVQRYYKESEQRHGVLVETINGLEVIKGIGAEPRMRHLWEGLVGASARSSQRARAWSLSATNVSGFVLQLSNVLVVVGGVHLVGAGSLSMGGIIASVMLGSRALAPFAQVSQLLVKLNQTRSALNGLDKMMRAEVERPGGKRFLHRPTVEGALAFDEVTFTYPGRKVPALRDVSFSLAPGEHVGVIGRVGSGKSTLAKLVLGLYEPDSGMVLLDGTDLRQVNPIDLRRHIGYVAQEPFLFRGTIRDNVSVAAPHLSDQRILQACALAGVDDLARQIPEGYDTLVGERGDGLSGGQRQLITLARALVRDPPILLMDEPTSAMDSQSEKDLFRRLRDTVQGRTLLLITHRASLLELVSRIIVLDRGRVVADGPRKTVLEALSSGQIQGFGGRRSGSGSGSGLGEPRV